MKAKEFEAALKKFNACGMAATWAQGKTWAEVYSTCRRGDWLLWLFTSTNPRDIKPLTLAKAHCANTVRHLMTDERSIAAIDTAIKFGNGECGGETLAIAASAAAAAYSDVYDPTYPASAASYAAYAAYAAASASAGYAAAYAAANAYAKAGYAAANAYASVSVSTSVSASDEEKNRNETAEICRKYLPIEIWNL